VTHFSNKKALTLLLVACAALGALATSAKAPPTQSVVFEGPGGRIPLTQWTLRKDSANRGLALGWRAGGFSGTRVSLPNVVDPTPYSGKAGAVNYEGSVAWYETSITAPAAGVYALSFQSANYRAEVWVDGHFLGVHRGSYLPFEMRSSLAAGTHKLVVRVDWRDPAQQSREGFHRTWFNWGGLDGEVDVRPVGESELSEATVQTTLQPDSPQAAQATVRVSVQVHNNGPQRVITPTGSLVHGTQTIPLDFAAQTLAHGQSATASTSVTVPEPALWSPFSPNLYALSLAVGQESSYSARIGLRQLTWSGGQILLNGQHLQLHGASIQEDARGHGDALTPSDQNTLVNELHAIGANAVRSQHPLDPAMLERLDAAGIVVWQGIGPVEGAANWYSTTPKLDAEAEQQGRIAVVAAELHPSIITWNLVDEVAENGRDQAEVQYVQTLTHWLHARDPTRMVAVDVWGDHPPVHAGALYQGVDAIAETDYTGWYDKPTTTLAQQRAMMRARLAAMHSTFPGKVLIISEFGAESNTLNPPGSPGSYGFQARLLANHIAVYERDPELSGMLIWDLRDYPLTPTFAGGSIHGRLPKLRLIEGINQKGLFTYTGAQKPAVGAVARLFRALPAD
jgi:Glycosyl hydrolases family 2, TIM barrel domain/Glycosyl hydrolases family 2/Glycosyl hydrolases family 2, sugar binding domain